MRRKFSSLLLLGIAVVLVAGCSRTGLVYNVTDAAITPVLGNELSLDQVTRAIVAAGVAAGAMPGPARVFWNMRVVEPGHILAKLHIRSHMATVDIKYTTKSYTITYNTSTNLHYNPDGNTIHSNYNGWIQNLNNAINGQLATL